MEDQHFGSMSLTSKNMDKYPMRSAIYRAVTEVAPSLRGRLLDVGCGKMPYKDYLLKSSGVSSYLGIDIESAIEYSPEIVPDAYWDGQRIPYPDASFDSVIATEVLEHCPDIRSILDEIYRVLAPTGTFFFTVPFLWPLHEVPYDECRYTPFHLEKVIYAAGFEHVEIKATGGWNACLAQMLGLWAVRGIYGHRQIVSKVLLPVVSYLLRTDHRPTEFKESTMVLGLQGVARKT